MLVQNLVLNYSMINIQKWDTFAVEPIFVPPDAENASVTWISTNISIATVDQYGTITGVTEGECSVIAVTSNNISATCKVTVTAAGIVAEFERTTIAEAEDYVYTPKGIRPSLTKFTAPLRGPTYTEDQINFFNELAHDILLANKTIGNLETDRNDNLRILLEESENAGRYTIPNGMALYNRKVLIKEVFVAGIDSSVKKRLRGIQDSLDDIDANTIY